MLTDSRSFLSYARYEYFRCILCNLLGTRVENWEFPSDDKTLKTIVESICLKMLSDIVIFRIDPSAKDGGDIPFFFILKLSFQSLPYRSLV